MSRMIPLKIADMAVAACNEEIAKLQADNARLKAELDRVTSQNGYHHTGLAVGMLREELAHKCHDNLEIRKAHQATVQMVRNLKAEVERLRKAGDEMHRAIKVSDPILDWKIELWNAAKEGKPSV